MVFRIFRSIWFFSLLAVTVVLLYSYASMPEEVVVKEQGQATITLSRDTFFYIVLSFLAIINVFVFIVARIMVRNDDFKSWYYGLVTTFNFFFMIGVAFVSLYNSGESYDYSRLEVIIYGSIGLFIAWGVAWPVYLLYKRYLKRS
jgi:hypothetical protein